MKRCNAHFCNSRYYDKERDTCLHAIEAFYRHLRTAGEVITILLMLQVYSLLSQGSLFTDGLPCFFFPA
jgi:hypothetical protein